MNRRFYVGRNTVCGCITAAMVDDERTTPAQIAEFAKSMGTRRMEHLELDGNTPLSVGCFCQRRLFSGAERRGNQVNRSQPETNLSVPEHGAGVEPPFLAASVSGQAERRHSASDQGGES